MHPVALRNIVIGVTVFGIILIGVVATWDKFNPGMGLFSPIRKDTKPQKIDFGKFAEDVTRHLLDTNPESYRQSMKAASEELYPTLWKKLAAKHYVPADPNKLEEELRQLKIDGQTSTLEITSVQIGDLTDQGFLHVQVDGTAFKKNTSGTTEYAVRFDYLLAIRSPSRKPVVLDLVEKGHVVKSTSEPLKGATNGTIGPFFETPIEGSGPSAK